MKIYRTIPDGYILTRAGIENVHVEKPNRMFPLESSDEVVKCREWIQSYAWLQPSINPSACSYTLKHQVEEWAHKYVSNGDFIKAALAEDYKFSHDVITGTQLQNGSLNALATS